MRLDDYSLTKATSRKLKLTGEGSRASSALSHSISSKQSLKRTSIHRVCVCVCMFACSCSPEPPRSKGSDGANATLATDQAEGVV